MIGEVDSIRKSRLRTHGKRNKKLIRAGKVTAFWYMSVFAAAALVSPTFAGFTSSQEIEGTIEAGNWPVSWKHTDVSLTVENKEIESCEPVELQAKFANQGKYETEEGYWKVEGKPGDPKKIKKLESGESVTLKFKVNEPGIYSIKAYQEGKHPNEFLKKITVTCEKGETEEEIIEEVKEAEESQEQPDKEMPQKEEKQDIKPENNEKKDKDTPKQNEPAKPEDPQDEANPPAGNDTKPKEQDPVPAPKPTPAPEPVPDPSPPPETPAVKEESANTNTVKDGEE